MTTFQGIPAADLHLLGKFDTPTVCNVIELFDCRPRHVGYLDGRIQSCFPRMSPMVGYASTATFRSAAPPRAGGAYASLSQQLEGFAVLPGPAVVVFQDLDNPAVAATFGEVMCSSYKAFGAAGIITSGAGRDLEQVEAIGFPCFTGGTICSHGNCHILQRHEPVHVGGVMIQPGDLLHGDRNGVTTIPIAIASAVAHGCAEFMAAESVILDYVRAGKVDAAGFSRAQQGCKDRIDALARKLKSSTVTTR